MKKINKARIKHFFLGKSFNEGFIGKISVYLLLIIIGFVYLYPLLKMFAYSIKDLEDLVNPTVQWIPTKIYLGNYKVSYMVLNYGVTLAFSLLVTLVPALLQTITTSVIGYALARFKFKGKVILFAIILLTYLLPVQVYMIPRYVLFDQFGILDSAWSIILPAGFGQGLSSAIFILIFYQFFRMQPKALYESAKIDGANAYQTFLKIAVPLAVPAYLTAFLFSFVWYWNETYVSSLFIGSDLYTLQLKLFNFTSQFNQTQGLSEQALNEAIRFSATILIILPVLLVYVIMQKWFVEGIDRTGITGE